MIDARSLPPRAARPPSTGQALRTTFATHWLTAGAVAAVSLVWALANLRTLTETWSDAVPLALDNRFQAVVIDWVQGALLGQHVLFDLPMFVPATGTLTFSDHLIGIAIALLPLRSLGLTPAAAYNTGLVLGVVVTALAAYVMGAVVTRRRSAAIAAAAVYGLGPISWLATIHINLVWRAGPPLLVAALWAFADRCRAANDRPIASDGMTRLLLAEIGAVVAWQCLVSFFYVPFMMIVAAAVIVARRADLARRGIAAGSLAVLAGLAIAAISYIPHLATRRQYGDFTRTLDEANVVRAVPFETESANVVWGWLLGTPHTGLGTFQAFPGMLAIAVIVAVAVSWRRPGIDARARVAGLAIMIVGAALAAGPGSGPLHGWLPFGLAFRFVPGFAAIRASGRFALLALLGVAILAAIVVAAAAAVLEQRGRRTIIVMGAATALVVGAVEGLSTGRPAHPAHVGALDHRLAEITEPGGVLYLPMAYSTLGDFAVQEQLLYRGATHHRPLVNGFSGYYPPSAFRFAELLQTLPDEASLGCLATHGIRFVVVSEHVPTTPWSGLTDPLVAEPLELIASDGTELLYRLPDDVVPVSCPLD